MKTHTLEAGQFIAVHIISFSVSFLSRVDELNKLASLQCMGLHSSAGRALQRYRRGHGFESRWSPENLFFGLFSQLLKLRFTAMVTYSFHLYSRSSHHFIQSLTKIMYKSLIIPQLMSPGKSFRTGDCGKQQLMASALEKEWWARKIYFNLQSKTSSETGSSHFTEKDCVENCSFFSGVEWVRHCLQVKIFSQVLGNLQDFSSLFHIIMEEFQDRWDVNR